MITQSFSKTYKGWVLFLCFLMMASNYIDRSIITILAQPIKEAFALSDMQVGALGGLAFAALYIVAGFPLARLADRHNRVNIISISLAVWSAMTALCGIAQSYLHLLLFRVGVGIGEAGASPAAQSLLCDYFPPSRRASAFSVFSFGGPMGGLFGAIAAGAIAQSYGWRAAFLLVGVPGIALALLFKFTTREPVRGSQDVPSQATADAVTVPSLWAVTRHLFGKSTFVQIAAGAAVANFALQGILQFTAAMFVRRFAVGLAEAGLVMGLIGGLCGGLGILAGGFGTDWAGKRDARWYLWLPAAGLVLCTPLYVLAFVQSSWRASTAMLMVPAALSYVFIAPMLSVTQNLVGPRMRATAVALLTLVTASVGVALGPIAVGWLSDHLAARSFAHFGIGEFATICRWMVAAPGPDTVRAACRTASAAGVTQAVVASTFLLLWAGLHFLIASRSIRRDLMANASYAPAPAGDTLAVRGQSRLNALQTDRALAHLGTRRQDN